MGYTHYWNKAKKVVENDDTLIEIRGHLDSVLKRHKNKLQYEGDIPQSPELYIDWKNNSVCVRFNGKGDDAHETFAFNNQDGFSFCKTARKDYDQAVCECLLILHHYFDISLSSDGFSNYNTNQKYKVGNRVSKKDTDGTWGEAVARVNKLLGTTYTFYVDNVYSDNKYFSYKIRQQ